MDDTGVQISLGEGFLVIPGADCGAFAHDLDLMHELRVPRINTLGLDPDRNRTFDQFAILTELAAERGMRTTLEMMPGSVVGDLEAAVAAVRHVARPDFQLLVDTMHLARSGAGAEELRALDPGVIGYAQLSDNPVIDGMGDYLMAATFERMVPGTGILPLADILEALPTDLHIGLEVPMRSQAEAGVGPVERLRPVSQPLERSCRRSRSKLALDGAWVMVMNRAPSACFGSASPCTSTASAMCAKLRNSCMSRFSSSSYSPKGFLSR